MQHFCLHSIPLKEVVTDLAKEMNTPLQKNCNEYCLEIPEEYGVGFIKGTDFEYGLGIISYDCTFKKDTEIRFVVDTVHPLKLLFCETGSFVHYFQNEDKGHSTKCMENIMVASTQNNGHILQFKKEQKTIINSVEINRAKYMEHIECELQSLNNNLKSLFRDTKANEKFYYHGNYCLKMANIMQELKDRNSNKGLLHRLFLESSTFKILLLQIFQYQDDLKKEKSILRQSELISVKEAAAIIDQNIADFETIKKLAKTVGLSANKLQDGFKETYNTTVNGYVHNKRLTLASNLLQNSDYSISEIVYMIGLSSKSYFSKIYKEKYGISPSSIKNNHA